MVGHAWCCLVGSGKKKETTLDNLSDESVMMLHNLKSKPSLYYKLCNSTILCYSSRVTHKLGVSILTVIEHVRRTEVTVVMIRVPGVRTGRMRTAATIFGRAGKALWSVPV